MKIITIKCLILIVLSIFIISCDESTKETGNDSETQDIDNSVDDENSDTETSDEDLEQSDEVVGGFVVKLNAPKTSENDGYTSIFGKIYDGPTPQAIVWEPESTSGNCTLYKPRVPFCEESCGGSAVCVEDDVCMNYPKSLSAGTITVKGIETSDGKTEFTMSPISNNYQSADTHPYPAFDEGGSIELTADGDTVKKFTLTSFGIAPFVLLNETIPLKEDSPLTLSWEEPSVSDQTKVHIRLDISHHGGSKGKIECVTLDSGSLEISSDLLEELLNLGVAGFPTIIVSRMAVGNYQSEYGIINLSVSSEVEKEVLIDGLTSCTDDEDCADGETCQDDLTCS